jgi:hypothetical protein
MGFNFKAAEARAQKDLSNKGLALMLLGQSGGGKSFAFGTFGVKTLFLYGTGEDHGPTSARKTAAGDLIPVCWDFDDAGERLSPDKAYKRLLDALSDVDGIKAEGFGAVVVDGATELETLIRKTSKWEQACLTDKGKHNNFAESDATKAMFRPVLEGLKDLQRKLGIHYAMSCILDIKQLAEDGEIQEASPKLSGYGVAENLIQQFPDIVAIGRMRNKKEQIAHRLQFLASVTKTSKDATGHVKKTMNFNPRLAGFKVDELPGTLEADLAALAKLKAGSK